MRKVKRKGPRPIVGIIHDGEKIVHASAQIGGDYPTLCGCEQDDPTIGLSPFTPPENSIIDCEFCKLIFLACQDFNFDDFK